MAETQSTMLALGTPAPTFTLPDVVSGRPVSLETFANDRALLVMFICCHCPYVKHVQGELARVGRDYTGRGVGIVAISSNDARAYPDDAPDKLAEMARANGFGFPVCHDDSQDVAKAFMAACTPEFFLFDQARRLVYRGQLDGSRPGRNVPVTGADLRASLDAVLTGQPVSDAQRPGVGCNIKWKPGHAPSYFAKGR
jgi:peroxiredoxin